MISSTPFCGRRAELARMLEAWDRVLAGGAPELVVVLAESGLGKTRLAQEFFAHLSARQAEGAARYWPASLGVDGNNLRVNPELADCSASVPMPFLWWGIRLVDPLSANSVGAGVLSADYERYLKPHLEQRLRAGRRTERRAQALGVGRGLLLDVATDFVPFAGLARSLGEAAVELGGLYQAARADAEPIDVARTGEAHARSLTERVIADLARLLGRDEGEPVPGVLLIDDAQFSSSDPGLVAFVGALFEAMSAGGWPLLVLISHWEREWSETGTIADLVRRQDDGAGVRTGIIRLRPVDDLSAMLDTRLPGLTAPQRAALLERADGNPRFLNEMLLHAASVPGRALFEGRDTTRALTEKGLARLLALSVRLHDLITERLGGATASVQQAVTLGSLQGVEFLPALVGATAAGLEADAAAIASAVGDAEAPHAYVSTVDAGVAAFAQRIYFEVAREFLPACFDPDEARAALAATLRRMAREGGGPALGPHEQRRLKALMAGTFEDASDPQDLTIAAWALASLVGAASADGDVLGGYALARRLDGVLERGGDQVLDADLAWLRLVFEAAGEVTDRATQRRIVERLLRLTRESHADDANDWSIPMLARALVLAANFHLEVNEAAVAAELLDEAAGVLSAWSLAEDTAESLEVVMDLHRAVALAYHAQGRAADALAAARLEMEMADRLVRAAPASAAALIHQAHAAKNLGMMARRTKAYDLAHDSLRAAIAVFQDLVAAGHLAFREAVVQTMFDLLPVMEWRGEEGGLEPMFDEAIRLARELLEGADTHRHRQLLASILMARALRAARRDQPEIARRDASEAIALLERNTGPDWRPQANLAVLHDLLAELAAAAGDLDGGFSHAVMATDLARDELAATRGYDAGARLLLHLLNRAWLAKRLGRDEDAEASLGAAEAIREWLPAETRAMLTQALDRLATLRQGQTRDGETAPLH